MSRTSYVYLKGKAKYCKLLGRGDAEYRCWSTGLYLTPESYDTFMKMKENTDEVDGILNEVKKDDDGYYVNLRRPFAKVFQGKEKALDPVIVLDHNNLPWQSHILIGNGSDITCKVEHYTYKAPFSKKKGSAIRLLSARVDQLVPFEMDKDFTEDQQKQVKGLAEQPRMTF